MKVSGILLLLAALPLLLGAADDKGSIPVGEPVLEPPASRAVGVYWIIRGDSNADATIELSYRKAGQDEWKAGVRLFRVEKGPHLGGEFGSPLTQQIPLNAWLFAGSQMGLEPGTAYDVRLRLSDPDGGAAERILKTSTCAEPSAPVEGHILHVAPGNGGGEGSALDPYKGLEQAQEKARPGDIFKIQPGLYAPPFVVKCSGEPDRPIVFMPDGDGPVFIGGLGPGPLGIRADGIHDVWFERLSVRQKELGFSGRESARLRIIRCSFEKVRSGILADTNQKDQLRGWWIRDNYIEGVTEWPGTEPDKPPQRTWGIRIAGSDHEILHNRIQRFNVGIGTVASVRCAGLDLYRNDLCDMSLAGIFLDGPERNIRCVENRIVNAGAGIWSRTVFGGPVYLVRNVLANISGEPFLMEARPSGVLVYHNTAIRQGPALLLQTESSIRNCQFRNNLFVGTSGAAACRIKGTLDHCDLDYDGFWGGPWESFLQADETSYRTPEALKEKGPAYRHALALGKRTVFAESILLPTEPGFPLDYHLDLRLDGGAGAVDSGIPISGINDGWSGKAPDLGALECGRPLPDYGIRPPQR